MGVGMLNLKQAHHGWAPRDNNISLLNFTEVTLAYHVLCPTER
jgi:hypothetical protein